MKSGFFIAYYKGKGVRFAYGVLFEFKGISKGGMRYFFVYERSPKSKYRA
jgi:hypothetical protein